MTRRELLATGTAAMAAAPAIAGPVATAERDFDSFLDRVLADWLRVLPENASAMRYFQGSEMDRLDGLLNSATDEGAHELIRQARSGLAQLAKFNRNEMSAQQKVSASLLEYQLRGAVEEEAYLDYTFPLNQFIYAVQVQFPVFMTDIHPLRSVKDAENYLLRLEAGARKIDEASRMMKERAARGIRLPRFIADETTAQMKRFIAPEPAKNLLVTSFAEHLKRVPSLDAARQQLLTDRAQKLVRGLVYPAYRRALVTTAALSADASNDAGLWRFPGGQAAYGFFLRRYTTTNLSPAEVHKTGLKEVARLEAATDQLLRKLGYKTGSIEDRFKALEKAESYQNSPAVRETVLIDYTRFVRENAKRSAEAFAHRPKAECVVQRIPEYQEANAAAFYSRPSADGSRPGIFNVPLPGPQFSRPKMRTLAAHEAIPGHHFQLATQVEMSTLPRFRRENPFSSLSAFTEGWALYAEQLASELGWYKNDAPSEIGRLHEDLFRARRLVADTGIHTMRWTREQAVAYGIAQSEVDRYVVLPGQACSYKIGQLKIVQLRDEARAKMGARFSLRAFHDVVLGNGSIPLALLEQSVRSWAAQPSLDRQA